MAGSGSFSLISQLFPRKFSLISLTSRLFSHLFSQMFPISRLFSRLFLTSQLFSQLFLSYISQLPSQLFLNRSRGFGVYWREKVNPRVMMDEVKFLYECVKAGKLSNAEAKEFFYLLVGRLRVENEVNN